MKWIKVEDRLPKEYKDVLILTKYGNMHVSYIYPLMDGGYEWWTGSNITYWRKLPNRPNKVKYE